MQQLRLGRLAQGLRHGMGDAVYGHLIATQPGTACRTYAPVGGHRDLLAYLVRRLLENGANSSFVHEAADASVPVAKLLNRPAAEIGAPLNARHARIARPGQIFRDGRQNSRGFEFGHEGTLRSLLEARDFSPAQACCLINGKPAGLPAVEICSPVDGGVIGSARQADGAMAVQSVGAARLGAQGWGRTSASTRAALLRKAAAAFENDTGRLLALLQSEAGKR